MIAAVASTSYIGLIIIIYYNVGKEVTMLQNYEVTFGYSFASRLASGHPWC